MIKSLELRNFVVFRGQIIRFPSNGLILISGPNGSGKSTLGSAIGCALSLKSYKEYLASRDLKFRDLISKDSKSALIKLTIDNTPNAEGRKPFAVNSEEFFVQRTLKLTGENFKTIGIKSGEFSSIEKFKTQSNFNLDSKFIYVSQGKLADLIPRDRVHSINYFNEIAQIVGIEDKDRMTEAFENLNEAKNSYDTFNRISLIPAQKEVGYLKEKFNHFKEVYLNNEMNLMNQILMSKIEERELIEEIEHLAIKKAEFTLNLSEKNEILEKIKQKLKDAKEEQSNKSDLRTHLQTEEDELENRIGKIVSEISLFMTAIGKREGEMESLIQNLHDKSEEISELKKEIKNLSQIQESPEKVTNLIQEREKIKNELQTENEKLRKQLNDRELELRDLKFEQEQISRAIGRVRNDIKRLEKKYRSFIGLKIEKDDLLSFFSFDTREIAQFINENNLDVYGPIGTLLDVKEPKLGDVIEGALGYNFLNSFVTNNEPHARFIDNYILDRRLTKTSVMFIGDEPKRKIGQIDDNYDTLGRVNKYLLPKNEIVERALSFAKGYRWVICKDIETANKITLREREVTITPGVDGFSVIKSPIGIRSIKTYGTQAKMRVLSGKIGRNILKEIEKLKMEENNLQNQGIKVREKIRELNHEAEVFKKDVSRSSVLKGKLNRLDLQINDFSGEFENLSMRTRTLESEVIKLEDKKDIFNESITDIKKDSIKLEEELMISRNRKKEIKENLRQLEAKMQSLSDSLPEITTEMNNLEYEVNSINEEILSINSISDNQKNEVNRCKDKNHQLNVKKDNKLESLKSTMNQVKKDNPNSPWIEIYRSVIRNIEQIHSRLDDRLFLDSIDVDQIYNEIITINADYDNLNKDIDMKNIVDKYDDARRTYKMLEEEKTVYSIQIKKRKELYRQNYSIWFEIMNDAIETVKNQFQVLIESVGVKGYVKISGWSGIPERDSPKVNIFASFSRKPPRSIISHTHSGGEATLMLIAFLLSLHSVAPQPFYILDEPDAHLDPLNREKMFKLIRNAAKDSQYFLISPQDKKISEPIADCHYFIFKDKDGFSIVKKVE